MASISKKDEEKLNYLNKQISEKDTNLVEKESGDQTNSMLTMMDDLIHAMQQLQKMIANQVSTTSHHTTHETTDKQSNIDETTNTIHDNKPKQQSQAATLLQQVQKAMEATVTQLSSSGRILKLDDNTAGSDASAVTDKMAHAQLSISEKWRLYTELVQMRNECTKEYCVAKMRLGQELGLSFNETKREMLIGLWSYRLCTVLFLRKHKEEADILSDIDQWERIEKARSEVLKKYRNKNYKYN